VSGQQQHQQQASQAVSVDATATPQALLTYAQDLTSVFYLAQLLLRRTTPVSGIGGDGGVVRAGSASVGGNAKAAELCQVLMKLATNAYHNAGSKYLHAGDLPGAVQALQRGLLVHSSAHTTRVVDFKYGRTAHSERESGAVPVVTLADFRNVTLTLETCTSLHW